MSMYFSIIHDEAISYNSYIYRDSRSDMNQLLNITQQYVVEIKIYILKYYLYYLLRIFTVKYRLEKRDHRTVLTPAT